MLCIALWTAYYSKASGVANCTGELGVAHPLHASLDNGHCRLCQMLLALRGFHMYVPLMPSARVSSVLKGILSLRMKMRG